MGKKVINFLTTTEKTITYLGVKMAPRDTEHNTYAKILGWQTKSIMVFSVVVNSDTNKASEFDLLYQILVNNHRI